jgi:hypothetical protein
LTEREREIRETDIERQRKKQSGDRVRQSGNRDRRGDRLRGYRQTEKKRETYRRLRRDRQTDRESEIDI